jgi:predicted nucleotidyltransferase
VYYNLYYGYRRNHLVTPVVSVRAGPREARLVRAVAGRLRGDPGFRLALESLVSPGPGGGKGKGRRPNRGAFADEAAALAGVLDRLVACLRPRAVRLFGSRATGKAEADSDFDLLVVLRDGEDASPDRCYAPLLGLGVGVDLVACTASEFAADVRVPGTICHEAAARGRLLYEGHG